MKRSESVAFCGLSIALLAASAWFVVPFGPIPFTLQTMVLVFIAVLFPSREVLMSVFGYLLLGAIGIPVFSGARGGLGVILGPTGGFLVGFGVGALVVAAVSRVWKESQGGVMGVLRESTLAALMLVCSYAFGWAQFCLVTDMGPMAAFMASVAPFIVLDIVKAAVGVCFAHALKSAFPLLRLAQKGAKPSRPKSPRA